MGELAFFCTTFDFSILDEMCGCGELAAGDPDAKFGPEKRYVAVFGGVFEAVAGRSSSTH